MSMKIKIGKPKTRVLWGFNPASRVVPNKKLYRRQHAKKALKHALTGEY